ncbi:MAG: SDR family NAD(P)-dependent oxidoreductase [Alphaproteobacteria bacterium GM202ARS2]|nr:SDR family NAD(P)-dependent oxidoreductase [Alphaproteobacteria bacterium GM202ARS2]
MVFTAKRAVLLCFGFGYTLRAVLARLPSSLDCVVACRSYESLAGLHHRVRWQPFAEVPDTVLARASHILISVPPVPVDKGSCERVWALYGERLRREAKALRWLGYVSSTSVYGDYDGAWVDEDSALRGTDAVARRRQQAERHWLDVIRDKAIQGHIFRLPGIYGRGRCVFDGLVQGRSRHIIKEGHVFSRIHVEDAAQGIHLAMMKDTGHTVYNVCDDEPAASWQVLRYGCSLLGVEPPPVEMWREGLLSEGRARFYQANRRVSNRLIKKALGFKPRYPTYRDGLSALYHSVYRDVANNRSNGQEKKDPTSGGRRL